jgi:hypothetical protein
MLSSVLADNFVVLVFLVFTVGLQNISITDSHDDYFDKYLECGEHYVFFKKHEGLPRFEPRIPVVK